MSCPLFIIGTLLGGLISVGVVSGVGAEGSPLVHGLQGSTIKGGCAQLVQSHLGRAPVTAVRHTRPALEMSWQTAALPADIPGQEVTFVWTGAMGLNHGRGGDFRISVNGHAAISAVVVLKSTRFTLPSSPCELLYEVLWTRNNLDSSGHFYLTVPVSWLTPGQPATIKVETVDCGSLSWMGVMDAPPRQGVPPAGDFSPVPAPALPPPPGQEADYAWYVKQYPDPVVWTPIGPPADPAETGVSHDGQLIGFIPYNEHRRIAGTSYLKNALVFALSLNGRLLPIGAGTPARQAVDPSNASTVTTTWSVGDIQLREIACAEPLSGRAYQTGRESTLAWAAIELTNAGDTPLPVICLASLLGNDEAPIRANLAYRDGVLFENGSALVAVQSVAAGFEIGFAPVYPADAGSAEPLELLRTGGGLYNAITAGGTIEPGQTVRIVFNRVFHFPDAVHWKAEPVMVAPAELTGRSFEAGLRNSHALWASCPQPSARFETPDPLLNRIIGKAMRDGHYLTKRWDGRYIVFDSAVYRCQWDDASAKWFHALDLMGDHTTSERLLDTVFSRQGSRKPAGTRTREGCFSDVTNTTQDGSDASWASCNGWALWAIAEHARLGGDRAWVKGYRSKIIEGCEWILRERRFSKMDPENPCAGLIRGKFACDLADQGEAATTGVGYFVYTDAISYMGLHEAAQLLESEGDPDGPRLLEEAEAYRRDIIAVMDRLTDRSQDPWYLPWALHAPNHVSRYYYDVCGPINLAFACGDGGVLPRDDERIQQVIRWIIDHTHGGSLEETAAGFAAPVLNDGGAFYTQDLAMTLLELGRVEDFLRIFYTLTAAGVTHETLTTTEWGPNTMPHIHSIASLVRMYRSMMIQERDGGLHLLQGTPRRWLEQGSRIRITDAPTWYGPVSLDCASDVDRGSVAIHVTLPDGLGDTPVFVRLRLPDGLQIRSVLRDGREHSEFSPDTLVLRGVGDTFDLVAAVGR